MVRAGRRLRFAAWVLGPVGLILLVGAVGFFITGYMRVTNAGQAMEPTYSPSQVLLLQRIDPGEVRRGDVVVFQMPGRHQDGADLRLKRVIGLGGDHVADRPGAPLTVNGQPLAESYVMGGDPSAGTDA